MMAAISNYLPQVGLNAGNAVPRLGTLLVTTLAIHALSNLPKADALGNIS